LGKARKILTRSLIYRKIFRRKTSKEDIDRFIGIVTAARNIFEIRYPGSEFHVILWGTKDNKDVIRTLERMLRKEKIRLHLIGDILPDFTEHQLKYIISPHDSHPNSLAYRLMAEYVVERILGE